MSFSFEYAKSSRAKCKLCKNAIKTGENKLINHSFNQWSNRPTAESICAKCGVPLVKQEIELLQNGLNFLTNTKDELILISRNTKIV